MGKAKTKATRQTGKLIKATSHALNLTRLIMQPKLPLHACEVNQEGGMPRPGGAFRGTASGALVCDRLTAELGSTMLAIFVMLWT
jgi:hypothetical protein